MRIVRTDSQNIFGTLSKSAGIRDTTITVSLSALSCVHKMEFVCFFFVFITQQIYRTRETSAVGDSKGYASLAVVIIFYIFLNFFPGKIIILLF